MPFICTELSVVQSGPWWTIPDWWVVIVAALTGAFVAWQSWETQQAVKAANITLEVTKTKDRAKLWLHPQPINPQLHAIPGMTLRITNAGNSTARIGGAIGTLHLSVNDDFASQRIEHYALSAQDTVLKADETVDVKIWCAEDPLMRYPEEVLKGDMRIHLLGAIQYRDAFDEQWRFNVHYVWLHYGIRVWMPGSDSGFVGEWSEHDDHREIQVRPRPMEGKHWWRRTRAKQGRRTIQ